MPRQDGQQAQHQDDKHDLYYSVEQVARRLRVSARWLADQCRDGQVEHVHLARKRKFTPEQVQKLLDSHTVKPTEVREQERGHERAVQRVRRERAQQRR